VKIATFCERCGGFEQVLYEIVGGAWRVKCPACNGTGSVLTTVAETGQSPATPTQHEETP